VIKYREGKISAHHNYLVNQALTPGFALGDPNSKNSFYFLADFVPPEERPPRISAGLLDEEGTLLLELRVNRMDKNPGKCTYQSLSGGFQILHPSGKTLLEVRTDIFPRGYLTRINARLPQGPL
jgi:hypothetical protein